MMPSILESVHHHVDGWEKEPTGGLWIKDDDGRAVYIEREGPESYTVLLTGEYGVVAESYKESPEVAAAVAIGFMTEPALFEQRHLEAHA